MTPDGTIASGWPRYGVGAGVAPGVQQWPLVVADGSGGAVVAWQDERDSPRFAIYVNHVDAAGEFVPPGTPEGVRVSGGPGQRLIPRLASDGAGGAFIVWVDHRAGNGDIYAARVEGDGVVGAVIEWVTAEVDGEGVHLEWSVPPEVVAPIRLERRSSESGFAVLANLVPDGSRRVAYHDRDVEPGQRYGYRLDYTDRLGPRVTEVVWVTVPLPPSLALEAIHPNPAAGRFTVRVVLPGRREAWIEIVDPAGRVRARREVGTSGPGRHEVTMEPERPLAPGVYFVLLKCAGTTLSGRLCVIR